MAYFTHVDTSVILMRPRYFTKPIKHDLRDKMVFIGGPRQVGKTTLALSLLSNKTKEHPAYINWDTAKGREAVISESLRRTGAHAARDHRTHGGAPRPSPAPRRKAG